MTRPKIKMAEFRIKMAPSWAEARGLKMAPPLPRARRTGRDADPRRILPLNGAAWQRLRASVLADEPLCRMCKARGIVEAATDVDHHDGNPGNNERENLVPLCHADHSRKTAADRGKKVRQGCDEHGMPLDPAHPWSEPATARTPALLRPAARTEADAPEIAGE